MRTISLILLSTILLFLYSCNPTSDEVADFNDKIISLQVKSIESLKLVVKVISYSDAKELKRQLDISAKTQDSILQVLNKLKNIEEDCKFKDEAIKFVKVFKSEIENEYNEVYNLYSLPEDEYTKEEELRVGEIFKELDVKTKKAYSNFKSAQVKLAEKYNLEIED